MLRSLPVSMLCHTCTLNDVVRDDYQNEYDRFVANLERVRLEPSVQRIIDAAGQDVQCAAVLYFDARVSTPHGQTFDIGQSIVFDGDRYRVADIQRLYDRNRLHHLEVTLIDG